MTGLDEMEFDNLDEDTIVQEVSELPAELAIEHRGSTATDSSEATPQISTFAAITQLFWYSSAQSNEDPAQKAANDTRQQQSQPDTIEETKSAVKKKKKGVPNSSGKK